MHRYLRICTAVVGALTLTAGVGGCGSENPDPSSAPRSTAASPQATPPPPSPTATEPAESRQPSPTTASPTPCRAADLTLNGIESDGAAGHIGYRTVVTNSGSRPCTLLGDRVAVVYVDSTGRSRTLPTVHARAGSVASPILARGERAQMTLLIVNGYGGYDPSASTCAHPAVYRDLAAKLSGGGRLKLNGLVLDVKCGPITAYGWTAAAGAG